MAKLMWICGILLIAVVLFLPNGILGGLARIRAIDRIRDLRMSRLLRGAR